jgi:hypothetical protein
MLILQWIIQIFVVVFIFILFLIRTFFVLILFNIYVCLLTADFKINIQYTNVRFIVRTLVF